MITLIEVGFFVLLDIDATLGDDVEFENTRTVWGKWNISRLSQDFIDEHKKCFKTPPIINWTAGSQSRVLSINGFPISGSNCGFQVRGRQFESYE